MADTAPGHLLDAYRQLVQDRGCDDDHTTVSDSADNIYHSDAEMRDRKCADENSPQDHQEVPTPEEDCVSVICDGETRTADIKADPQHLTDGHQSAEGPSPQRSDDHMTKEYFLNLHNLIKSEDDAAVSLRSQTTPGHRVGAGMTDECGTSPESPGEPSGITEDKAADPDLHVIQPDYTADVYAPESPGTDLYNSGDVYAPERPYKCLTCDKSYTTAGQLSRHYRGHTLNLQFSCGTCGRLFERQDCLTTHQRIHSGERPYKCAVCDKAFRCLSTLTTHKTTHTGERPHKCGTCGKGFSCSSNLNKHRRVHTGEQPYRCAVCGKGFKQSSYLKMHERTHTGEKPYQCGTCGRGFSRADNLATHTRTHTGERPYKCTTCGKGFNQLASLNRHVMNIHERGKKLDS